MLRASYLPLSVPCHELCANGVFLSFGKKGLCIRVRPVSLTSNKAIAGRQKMGREDNISAGRGKGDRWIKYREIRPSHTPTQERKESYLDVKPGWRENVMSRFRQRSCLHSCLKPQSQPFLPAGRQLCFHPSHEGMCQLFLLVPVSCAPGTLNFIPEQMHLLTYLLTSFIYYLSPQRGPKAADIIFFSILSLESQFSEVVKSSMR